MTHLPWATALIAGVFLGWWFAQPGDKPTPAQCPNGAIGQVIHADGSTYCSYMSGRYKAQVTWRKT